MNYTPYYTPLPLAHFLIYLAEIEDNPEFNVLEPSCGNGAIIKPLMDLYPKIKVTGVEPNYFPLNPQVEDYKNLSLVYLNFEDYRPWPEKFDRVIMNPPFDQDWRRHISKAFNHLKVGGILVSIIPTNREPFDFALSDAQFFKEKGAYEMPIHNWASDKTKLKVIKLIKQY